jgi:hypothetical protein
MDFICNKKSIFTNKRNKAQKMDYIKIKSSVHDRKMVDEEAIKFPKQSYLFFDLGYLGFLPKDAIIFMPHKKPKNEELTKEQKFENYLISGVRITVEHAIGGVK